MADIKSPEQRSINMSHIRGNNTKPEEYIRKKLYNKGYRYRRNYRKIEGKPDIWLSKYKVAIFVNGCFWHRHSGCKYSYTPKSRVEFWTEKFLKNIKRDLFVKEALFDEGIRVLILWECTIKNMKKDNNIEDEVLMKIMDFLPSNIMYLEL